jgi:predicted nucleotidyltransferase
MRAMDGDSDTRIDVTDPAQVEDWSRRLGVSPDKLKEAVQVVGDQADVLLRHFSGSRREHGRAPPPSA